MVNNCINRRAERGNILFLILLAVVLFAALSYAVTSSLRSGGKDATSESVTAGAAAITQYVVLLRNEVQRLMLVNGCTTANLDWRDGIYKRYTGALTYYSYNGTPPSPKTGCAIFQAYGGPIIPQSFEVYKDKGFEAWTIVNNPANFRAGHAAIRWTNVKNAGTVANDIAIRFIGINKSICQYLLDPLNLPNIPSTDYYQFNVDANSPEPSNISGSSNIVDDPVNISGDFFAGTEPYSTDTTCQLGAVILPQ